MVTGYAPRLVDLARALAGQAAVALENGQLYQEIELLFDGFVRAAVTAIEQRDPVTSGHSERVADMTVRLATVVSQLSAGPYRDVVLDRNQLRELRYAALLHDFGKIIMDDYLGADYAAAVGLANARRITLFEAEEQVFHKTHAQIGAEVAEKWHMPEETVELVAGHHDYEEILKLENENAAFIFLADQLSKAFYLGHGGDMIVPVAFWMKRIRSSSSALRTTAAPPTVALWPSMYLVVE